MKLYFAGPLFTGPERTWNREVTAALRAAGHEVYLPQEEEDVRDPAAIFAVDLKGLEWAEAIVPNMDGEDPDSGTAWEVGFAFRKIPIVLVRTDFRRLDGYAGDYNPMLTESATVRLDLPDASTSEVAAAIVDALSRLNST
jgi:nucleoside 2-deoxyribosyltransferase